MINFSKNKLIGDVRLIIVYNFSSRYLNKISMILNEIFYFHMENDCVGIKGALF